MFEIQAADVSSSETLVRNPAHDRLNFTTISAFQLRGGDKIYDIDDDTRVLYQLSCILDGSITTIELDQNVYRLNEEGHLRRILTRHLYNLR